MNSPIIPPVEALQVAIQVSKCRSFTAASKALGLSPSAVSKSISRLEQQLHLKLFQRTTRSVSPTADGERFLVRANQLLADFDALLSETSNKSASVRGLLRISTPESFGRHVITPLVSGFLAEYPAIEIELDISDRYVDLAADGFDLAIRSGRLSDSSSLVARKIFRDPMAVVAASDDSSALARLETPKELEDCDAIVFRNPRTGRVVPWQFSGGYNIRPRRRVIVNDVEAALRLVLDGAGVAQLPLYLASSGLHQNRIVELLPECRPTAVNYSAVYLNRKLVGTNIRAFIDYVSQYAKLPGE